MKLVGATNWFVRGPFMIEGLLCGLGGALLAVLLLVIGKEVALPAILHNALSTAPDVHALAVPAHGADPARDRPRPRRDRLGPDRPPLPARLSRRSSSRSARRGKLVSSASRTSRPGCRSCSTAKGAGDLGEGDLALVRTGPRPRAGRAPA